MVSQRRICAAVPCREPATHTVHAADYAAQCCLGHLGRHTREAKKHGPITVTRIRDGTTQLEEQTLFS